MAREYVPPDGYESSLHERAAAAEGLRLAASGIMWGRPGEFPYWAVEGEERAYYRDWEENSVRVKYLALPTNTGRIPAELQVLPLGGSDGLIFYSLRARDVEFVWSYQGSDVVICEADTSAIIDSLDAPQIWSLAARLNSEACETYNPKEHYVDPCGELSPILAPHEPKVSQCTVGVALITLILRSMITSGG